MSRVNTGKLYRLPQLQQQGWEEMEEPKGFYRTNGKVALFEDVGGGRVLLKDMGGEEELLRHERVLDRGNIHGGWLDVTYHVPGEGAVMSGGELQREGWHHVGTRGENSLYLKKSAGGKENWVLEVYEGMDAGYGCQCKVKKRHTLRKGAVYAPEELEEALGLEVRRESGYDGKNKVLGHDRLRVSVEMVNHLTDDDYGKLKVGAVYRETGVDTK